MLTSPSFCIAASRRSTPTEAPTAGIFRPEKAFHQSVVPSAAEDRTEFRRVGQDRFEHRTCIVVQSPGDAQVEREPALRGCRAVRASRMRTVSSSSASRAEGTSRKRSSSDASTSRRFPCGSATNSMIRATWSFVSPSPGSCHRRRRPVPRSARRGRPRDRSFRACPGSGRPCGPTSWGMPAKSRRLFSTFRSLNRIRNRSKPRACRVSYIAAEDLDVRGDGGGTDRIQVELHELAEAAGVGFVGPPDGRHLVAAERQWEVGILGDHAGERDREIEPEGDLFLFRILEARRSVWCSLRRTP